jgi:hypothetical protein
MPRKPIPVTEAEYTALRECYGGVCLSCGTRAYGGVEPGAENYDCEECGNPGVFGIEQALLRGIIALVEKKPTPLRDSLRGWTEVDTSVEN